MNDTVDGRSLIAIALALYVVVLVVTSALAGRRVKSTSDFLVAGRRLGFWFASASLIATWYGAGALLTTSDEVRKLGVQRAAMDPLGAGVCLILAGLVLARPLHRAGVETLSDLFEVRCSRTTGIVSAALLAPTYLGWIAAQLVGLAGVLEVMIGVPPILGLPLVTALGLVLSWTGGMWSVTLTDLYQLVVMIVGLVVLLVVALVAVAGGEPWLAALADKLPSGHLELLPDGAVPVVIGAFLVGALGNLPGQDLFQRVFSAKDEHTAVRACVWSGVVYLVMGAIAVMLGLSARVLVGDDGDDGLPRLAMKILGPIGNTLFVLAIVAAVTSTLSSAMLSPAALVAKNVILALRPNATPDALTLVRRVLVVVALLSLGLAAIGENAYALLEDAYEIPLAGLLVPLVVVAYAERASARAAIAAMVVGTVAWSVHYALDWELFLAPLLASVVPIPQAVACAAVSGLVQLVVARADRAR